jgi:hypothetical protein
VYLCNACIRRAANTLLRRLEQTHATLMTVKHMLPAVPEAADVLTAYELTHQSMQQFIVNTHTEWFNTIDNSISKQLQDNLLVQDKADRKYQASVCNPHVLVVRVSDAAPWNNIRCIQICYCCSYLSHLSTVSDVS